MFGGGANNAERNSCWTCLTNFVQFSSLYGSPIQGNTHTHTYAHIHTHTRTHTRTHICIYDSSFQTVSSVHKILGVNMLPIFYEKFAGVISTKEYYNKI